MRGSLLAGALAAGVLMAGAGPAIASGGNDTSAKLRKGDELGVKVPLLTKLPFTWIGML